MLIQMVASEDHNSPSETTKEEKDESDIIKEEADQSVEWTIHDEDDEKPDADDNKV